MPGVAQIDQAVVAGQAVGQDGAVQGDMPTYDRLQGDGAAVGNDLGIDAPLTLEHAEDDGFLVGAAAALAAHAPWPEEGFIHFDFAGERRAPLAFLDHASADAEEDGIDRAHADAGGFGDSGGSQIEGKTMDRGPENGPRGF